MTSPYPTLDSSYCRPFHYNNDSLSSHIDAELMEVFENSLQAFHKKAGNGLTWDQTLMLPPEVFLVANETNLQIEAKQNKAKQNKATNVTKQH